MCIIVNDRLLHVCSDRDVEATADVRQKIRPPACNFQFITEVLLLRYLQHDVSNSPNYILNLERYEWMRTSMPTRKHLIFHAESPIRTSERMNPVVHRLTKSFNAQELLPHGH